MAVNSNSKVSRALIVLLSLQFSGNFVKASPLPSPQVLPGQVPPHLATHPALSSIQQGRESSLLQFAYNTQNRRGPSPSPLVLQNNQEQNLQLANRYATQRSGRPILPQQPQANLGPGGVQTAAASQQSPELKALLEIQKYKGQQGQNANYQPLPLTPANGGQLNYPAAQGAQGAHAHAHVHPDPGQDNEREDIRRLKALLNLAGRPGVPPASPNIGVNNPGQRGVLNPAQFNQNGGSSQPPFPTQNHGHDHAHAYPTSFPATAQSQNSLGTLQFGQGSPRPSIYPGSGGPNVGGGPNPVVHLPYNGAGAHQHAHTHGHDHHSHGQGRYNEHFNNFPPPPPYYSGGPEGRYNDINSMNRYNDINNINRFSEYNRNIPPPLDRHRFNEYNRNIDRDRERFNEFNRNRQFDGRNSFNSFSNDPFRRRYRK